MWHLDPTEQNPLNKYLWTCCFLLQNSLCYGVREPRTAPLQGEAVVWLQPSLSSVGLVVSMHWKATWSWMERGWMRTKRHSVQGGCYRSSKYCPTFHLSSLYLIALVLLELKHTKWVPFSIIKKHFLPFKTQKKNHDIELKHVGLSYKTQINKWATDMFRLRSTQRSMCLPFSEPPGPVSLGEILLTGGYRQSFYITNLSQHAISSFISLSDYQRVIVLIPVSRLHTFSHSWTLIMLMLLEAHCFIGNLGSIFDPVRQSERDPATFSLCRMHFWVQSRLLTSALGKDHRMQQNRRTCSRSFSGPFPHSGGKENNWKWRWLRSKH